ncbi:MAG: hypothetical protein AB7P37_18335 [Ramlibacter sp.]
MPLLRSLACGVAIGVSAAICMAGTSSAFFQVQIVLHTGLPTPGGGGGADPAPLPANPGGVVPPVVPPDAGAGGPAPVPTPVPVNPQPATPPVGVAPLPGAGLAASVPPSGICTSASASGATNATVRVVCSSGQFVSIEAAPGQPFAGTHGAAHRFNFGPGLPLPAMAAAFGMNIGAGTVTALRILNVNGLDAPLEMLVSF